MWSVPEAFPLSLDYGVACDFHQTCRVDNHAGRQQQQSSIGQKSWTEPTRRLKASASSSSSSSVVFFLFLNRLNKRLQPYVCVCRLDNQTRNTHTHVRSIKSLKGNHLEISLRWGTCHISYWSVFRGAITTRHLVTLSLDHRPVIPGTVRNPTHINIEEEDERKYGSGSTFQIVTLEPSKFST